MTQFKESNNKEESNMSNDFQALLLKGKDHFKFNNKKSFSFIVVSIIIFLIGAWTATYSVPSDSIAVIQRFGKDASHFLILT